MEYQKIINLLDNKPDQTSRFRTKNWVEIMITHVERITQIVKFVRFKTVMLKWSLWDYSNAYILVKGTITVVGAVTTKATRTKDSNDKQTISKNCAPCIDCISEINNTQVHNAKYLDAVMPMYN